MNEALTAVLNAYRRGYATILLDGRSLYDLTVDTDGAMRSLREALRRRCLAEFGMVVVSYSMAAGCQWSRRFLEEADRELVQSVLDEYAIVGENEGGSGADDAVRAFRGIVALAQAELADTIVDGRPLRFCFLMEFSDHLAPGGLVNGTQTEAQTLTIELATLAGSSQALRASGNMIIFAASGGMVDEGLSRVCHHIHLEQPDADEKKRFTTAALALYSNSRLASGLDVDVVAHLTMNAPNTVVDSLLRASHLGGNEVTAAALTADKARAVAVLSDGTLKVLDTERVKNTRLVGRNVAGPLRVLERYAQGLARGDSAVPVSVVLVGPPSSGKTDLAIQAAARAGVSAFEMISPKDQYVGGTERKTRLQNSLLREWKHAIAFVDEVTENLPLERGGFDGDSGASRAVTASLLTMLSDESLRGRTLVLGTTNCPWRCGDAMKTRTRFLAVLHPLQEDYADIIAATAVRVDSRWRLNATAEKVRQAANIFYGKGAGPRHIRAALSDARLGGSPTEDAVLAAARNLQLVSSWEAIEYADLWALRVTSFATDLPWHGDPVYPFPKHIAAVVDTRTGVIDHEKLIRRIEELRPHVNM